MHIPAGMTEEEVFDKIQLVAKKIAKKYRFGYYSEEDIAQEAVILIIQNDLLKNYDPSRPLENFLSRVLKNRLFNFKRDNYKRPDPPCVRCPLSAYVNKVCTAYENLMDCEFYKKWVENNKSKENIMHAISLEVLDYTKEDEMVRYSVDFEGDVDISIYEDIILNNLSIKERKLYIRFKEGDKISKVDLDNLFERVRSIVNEQTEA
jgi:hypothetical protein